jgi:hypothetical protein
VSSSGFSWRPFRSSAASALSCWDGGSAGRGSRFENEPRQAGGNPPTQTARKNSVFMAGGYEFAVPVIVLELSNGTLIEGVKNPDHCLGQDVADTDGQLTPQGS